MEQTTRRTLRRLQASLEEEAVKTLEAATAAEEAAKALRKKAEVLQKQASDLHQLLKEAGL